MPIFEYQCTECGETTEHLQLSSTAPLTACPECGGPVRKLLSAPAFQFKGTGWYVTDYAKNGKSSDPSGGNGTAKGSAGGSESGETKKASATDTAKKGSSEKKSTGKVASPSD